MKLINQLQIRKTVSVKESRIVLMGTVIPAGNCGDCRVDKVETRKQTLPELSEAVVTAITGSGDERIYFALAS
jgi:hypothetical protein